MLCNHVKVSPRQIDPAVKPALIEISARLLDEEGPRALTTRRIATEAGTSTMAVYTNFGGMSGLLKEMVYEGFARLQQYFAGVARTDDPVADLADLGRAYRSNAISNPHLYAVMFGGSSLAGFELSEKDRQHGRYNLVEVVECVGRCVDSGRFRQADAIQVAHQMWISIHGLVNLELGDYLIEPYTAEVMLEAQLVGLMVGAGDDLRTADESVRASARRPATVGPQTAPTVRPVSHRV